MKYDWLKTFWEITLEQDICQKWGLWSKDKNYKNFLFALLLGNANEKIFKKYKNTLFLDSFCPSLGKNEFSTKTSGKKSEKETIESLQRKTLN